MQKAPSATGVPIWFNWIGITARLILGGVLIVAGALKLPNLEASVFSVVAYQLVPYSWAKVLGVVLPVGEVVLGALLLLGLFTRISGLLGALMMVAYIVAIISVWVRGISIDCGCFSPGGPTDEGFSKYPWEIARDLGLALAGAWLFWGPRTPWALDQWLFGPEPEDRGSNSTDTEKDVA